MVLMAAAALKGKRYLTLEQPVTDIDLDTLPLEVFTCERKHDVYSFTFQIKCLYLLRTLQNQGRIIVARVVKRSSKRIERHMWSTSCRRLNGIEIVYTPWM